MTVGELYLEALSSGVITEAETSWLVEHQGQFSRLEEATALRLGRLLDQGSVQMGCRLQPGGRQNRDHQALIRDQWIEPLGRRRHRPGLASGQRRRLG
ncbi:hypothetical protein EVJ50_01275 [Synechococcus sp. RSCCF101]|uniref:hypothetical protein n=1 Tax=Synechococcus sp. RSCCF101 TaxID=2511069 RepID=UPI0012451D9F|nr:hypothetical protein [Synechococcus sp. RSCCF101]QEY31088.1 hypothetical protein EVJ50_01275 [Synechococcus sp. RSCCF101]